jgi:hypothetical protein
MNPRKIHKIIGLILVLPFFGWAITGLIFYLKPGYADAYDMLVPKTYPLDTAVAVPSMSGWQEVRCVRTILGTHVLVRTDSGWLQVHPQTLEPRKMPGGGEIRKLLADAFTANPQRYGHIARMAGDTAWTDTDVEVILDWNSLSFQQRGKDTDRIDLLYRIHYLQWTGVRTLDRVAGLAGIILVITLAVLGVKIAFTRRAEPPLY